MLSVFLQKLGLPANLAHAEKPLEVTGTRSAFSLENCIAAHHCDRVPSPCQDLNTPTESGHAGYHAPPPRHVTRRHGISTVVSVAPWRRSHAHTAEVCRRAGVLGGWETVPHSLAAQSA
ncbi:hypothetical protein AAFF_G00393210 [Aldrovandia affinis]|uniref:Uncharacterized protein n=1 Tax=Aldrovandia affinis TaxID=143900 RepID=A0AAD7SDY2_9TELE|nr:hypothetical protein AAFF_G00393210 [Aldrovandia affinis]